MRRKSALNLIHEVLSEARRERLSFNEVCLAVHKYCDEELIKEPSFSTILAKLQKETNKSTSRIKWVKDGRIMRYYLGAPEDKTSAKLVTWIPEGGEKT